MGKSQRDKGKRGERLACEYLRSLGFGDKETTHRGAQHSGGPDSPDVKCKALAGVHLEVKYGSSYTFGSKLLEKAAEQAKSECAPGKRWAVLWCNRAPRWRLTANVFVENTYSRATFDDDNAIKDTLEALNGPTN